MTESLYSEPLKVQYKCSDAEDRQVIVKVSVEVQTTTSPLHRKDLLVRLTDDKDPFFLYNLCLSEEDFQSLKNQQGLLVDFSAFPQRFIALLKQCQIEESNDVPKFLLHFIVNDGGNSFSSGSTGSLKVIETNPFKHLTHLSLNLMPGNDGDVKTYLATCLKISMEREKRLNEELSLTREELNLKLKQTRLQLSTRTQELNQLQVESGGRSERLTSQHSKEMNMEREKNLKIQEELQQRYDRERKEMESSYHQNIKQKDSRIFEIENVNKELTDRRYRAEATIREQKSKLGSLEEEHRRCRSDLQQCRRDNNALESERHSQEKSFQQFKTRVAVLEQDLISKEQLVSRITSSLDGAQQQKDQLDESRAEQQSRIKKLEATIQTMSDELLKANEIIKRLQDELRGYMGKIKLKNEVTTKQELLLGEKEKLAADTQRSLEQTADKLKNREEEASELKKKMEVVLNKLEESKGLLKTNENVINWLNKQLNERQISSRRHQMESDPIHSNPLPSFEQVSSINSFKPAYNRPHGQPNYSTPINSTPPNLTPSPHTPVSSISPHLAPSKLPRPIVAPASQLQYNQGKVNNENLSPAGIKENSIDPKYLTHTSEPHTYSVVAANRSPPKLANLNNKPLIEPSKRLSQHVVNKASLSKANARFQPQPNQQAIVSAYFSGAINKS